MLPRQPLRKKRSVSLLKKLYQITLKIWRAIFIVMPWLKKPDKILTTKVITGPMSKRTYLEKIYKNDPWWVYYEQLMLMILANACLTFISVINWFSIAFKWLQVDDSAIFVSWGFEDLNQYKMWLAKQNALAYWSSWLGLLPESFNFSFYTLTKIEAFVGVESGLLDLHSGRLHATFRVRIPKGAGLFSPCLFYFPFSA